MLRCWLVGLIVFLLLFLGSELLSAHFDGLLERDGVLVSVGDNVVVRWREYDVERGVTGGNGDFRRWGPSASLKVQYRGSILSNKVSRSLRSDWSRMQRCCYILKEEK